LLNHGREAIKIVLYGKYPIETVFDHFPEEEVYRALEKEYGEAGERGEKIDVLIYLAQKDVKTYKNYLEEICQKKPKSIQDAQVMQYLDIAWFYKNKGNYKKAREYFEKWYSLSELSPIMKEKDRKHFYCLT